MIFTRRICTGLATLAGVALLLLCASTSSAYVEAPMSLGAVLAQSSNILTMRVEKVDKEKNLIIFRKVQDLKGKHPGDVIKHNIAKAGFHPREWQFIMEWAEPGKIAVFCHNGGASETCINNYWYQAYAGGEWWNMSHGEPYLLRSFAGNPDKLAAAVTNMLAGQEVVVPCMVDGDKNTLQLRTGKIQRLKASMKLQDYNPKRDFAGWGGEDFRLLAGMPAFTHYSSINRVDPGALGLSSADVDGDGKPDLCLFGASKVALLQNGGTSFNEVALPGVTGARAAVWADYNGDGKPDLFVATPSGPKLFANQGGTFKDETAAIPPEPYWNLTAAAWLDADGDGRPDLLVSNGFHGLRLYRNRGPQGAAQFFEDVSWKWGLGPEGIGGRAKHHSLVVADVNGDGRPDFLYGNQLVFNTPQGFTEAKDAGLVFIPGATPVFADFDGDNALDLFVPQSGICKLFQNDGKGRFADVTAKSGALAQPLGYATSAVAVDFNKDGRMDLVIGCVRGINHLLLNQGDGTFVDAGESIGFQQRVFNTRALLVLDLNRDGALDLVLNNEGVESAVLLGRVPLLAGPGVTRLNAPGPPGPASSATTTPLKGMTP